MFDPKKYPSKIIDCQVEHDGETLDFKVRTGTLRETAKYNIKVSDEEGLLRIIARFMVNDDGSPISSETANDILDMGLPVANKITAEITNKLGVGQTEKKP